MALFIESHLLIKEDIHVDFKTGRVSKSVNSITTVEFKDETRPVKQGDLAELKMLLWDKMQKAEKLGALGEKYREEFILLFACVHCLNAQEATFEILEKE